MIDLHSHILPKFDDGARDTAEALALCRILSESGFDTVVATPHIHYHKEWENDLSEAARLYQALLEVLQEEQSSLNLRLGCELYASEELLYVPDLCKAAIQGTNTVLMELPPFGNPVWLEELLYVFKIQGLTPIIAHPARCEAIQHHSAQIDCLFRQKVMFQLNLGSLAGFYGRITRRTARKLLGEGHYQVIGSDLHRAQPQQYDVGEAVKELERRRTAIEFENLTKQFPREILGV